MKNIFVCLSQISMELNFALCKRVLFMVVSFAFEDEE